MRRKNIPIIIEYSGRYSVMTRNELEEVMANNSCALNKDETRLIGPRIDLEVKIDIVH